MFRWAPSPVAVAPGPVTSALAFRPRNTYEIDTATVFSKGQLEIGIGVPGEEHSTLGVFGGVVWTVEGGFNFLSRSRHVEQE